MKTALLCLILSGFLGHPAVAQRKIVGGFKAVERKRFSHQVSIWKRKNDEYFCTGSIISPRLVLTCAHCFEDLIGRANDIYIKAGALKLNSKNAIKHDVEKIMQHEYFSSVTKKFDLGLLLIVEKFEFTDFVQPIDLTEIEPPDAAVVTISGWGVGSAEEKVPSEHLMVIGRVKINLETCRNSAKIMKFQHITNNSFCTATSGHIGTCRGDSGGPVTYMGKLVGIVTGGVDCAKGLPDIHVNIVQHKPWILVKCLYLT